MMLSISDKIESLDLYSSSPAEEKEKENTTNVPPVGDIESGESLTFNPPVYTQRYLTVVNVLDQEKWRNEVTKVVDLGCAEFKLFKYLKSLNHVHHIIGVDLDESLMSRCKYEAKPMLHEYLSSFSHDLTVDLYVGSIAEPDSRLIGVDAVICIELIEHLFPETLERVPFTVFECIRPKIAIFTTPNSEFNVLFKLEGFRHPDHKFEWTRREFEEWCANILKIYDDYEVSFEGIGEGPEGTQHLGCVSQMAVFTRLESNSSNTRSHQVTETPYKLFESIKYPFTKDERSNEQKLTDEIKYWIHNVLMKKSIYSDYLTDDGCEIPINFLFEHVKNFCDDNEQTLRTTLTEMGYTIECNKDEIAVIKASDESDSESYSNYSEYDTNDYDSICASNVTELEEEWN